MTALDKDEHYAHHHPDDTDLFGVEGEFVHNV
jgi:hypothetical protein